MFTDASNMDKSWSVLREEGGRVELNCTVSGLPTPVVTWTKVSRTAGQA